jgi:energy-coupling factor transport system permease protein
MKNLEFFRNISIGQYVDSGSRFHRFRPTTKYIFLIALATLAIATPTPAGVALVLAVAICLAAASRISIGLLLRSLTPIFPVLVLTALLQFLFRWPGDATLPLVSVGPFSFTLYELWIVALIFLRSSAMMMIVSWFTSVTTEADAARGIEDMLRPLGGKVRFVHRLSLATATAIRFVPIVAGELEEIVKAQASRGADFGAGKKGIIAKAKAYAPLFVPVTIRALERAELLAEAMESRCYTGEGRTPPQKKPAIQGEVLAVVSTVVLSIIVLVVDTMYIKAWIRPF